jgi:hypothetical protein
MASLSLAKPVENVSPDEARVLALVSHLVPLADAWRVSVAQKARLAELEKSLAEKQSELESEDSATTALKANSKLPNRALWLAISAVLLFVGAVALASKSNGIGAAAIIAGIVASVFAVVQNNRSRLGIERRLDAIDVLAAQIADDRTERERVIEEIDRRAVGFPEVTLAGVRFPLEVSRIVGKSVVINPLTDQPETVLKTVDLSHLQSGLTGIAARARQLLALPPLLAAGKAESDDDPIDRLFGEEQELQDLVTEFTINLGTLRDVNLPLPLVSPRSHLLTRLVEGRLEDLGVAPTLDISVKSAADTIAEFANEVNETKARSEQLFADLRDVDAALSGACYAYSNSRKVAMNTIHANLAEVLNRADFLSRRFYCPRTTLNVRYLQDLLGIDPVNAYQLPINELISRLRSDKEVDRRCHANPELERQLIDAYWSVWGFLGPADGSEPAVGTYGASPSRSLDDQFRPYLKIFNDTVTKILTGATYPILNISSEAQLYFDPESSEWRSDTLPYEYSTPDIMRYGGVVKTYSDVLLPMWESLWTEKADFRKSELFRTNEAMIGMSEKEGRQVIEIANQFRDDMRSVREHFNLIESEIAAKASEIRGFRDSVETLGVLSDRMRMVLSDQRLGGLDASDQSTTKSMDRYESQLQILPEIQTEYRGTARDPIELVKDTHAIGSGEPVGQARLLPPVR